MEYYLAGALTLAFLIWFSEYPINTWSTFFALLFGIALWPIVLPIALWQTIMGKSP